MKSRLEALGKKRFIVYGAVAAALLLAVSGVAIATDATGVLTGSTSSSPSPAAQAASGTAATSTTLPTGGGGGKNIVQVVNQQDGELKIDGKVQLNRIPESNAAPVDMASAYSSCTNCQTLAVALQINLISKSASYIHPQNAAVALNYQCTNCHTIAYAWQYNMTVDDPTAVPNDVNQLMAAWRGELANIKTQSVTLGEAINRMNSVIAQFQSLAAYLDQKQDQTTDTTSPNASPPPAASPAAGTSASPSSSAGATPTPTASPQPSASASP
jgi:putative peptide zinc metalloprotease protein